MARCPSPGLTHLEASGHALLRLNGDPSSCASAYITRLDDRQQRYHGHHFSIAQTMKMMTTVDAHHDATVLERDEFVALYAAMQGHGDAAAVAAVRAPPRPPPGGTPPRIPAANLLDADSPPETVPPAVPGVWLQPRPAGIVPLQRPVALARPAAQPPPAIERARGAAGACVAAAGRAGGQGRSAERGPLGDGLGARAAPGVSGGVMKL